VYDHAWQLWSCTVTRVVGLFEALSFPTMQFDGFCSVARPHVSLTPLGFLTEAVQLLHALDRHATVVSYAATVDSTVSLLQLRFECVASIACQPLLPSSVSSADAVNKSMSIDLEDEGITCVLLHPGYVRTDMTSGNGLIDVDQSVSGLLSVLESDLPLNGKWYDYKQEAIPW